MPTVPPTPAADAVRPERPGLVATFRKLWPYLWPHGRADLQRRVFYAFGLLPGWTAVRDSISLNVYYRAAIDLSSSVVIALSQSGQTPDVGGPLENAPPGTALPPSNPDQPPPRGRVTYVPITSSSFDKRATIDEHPTSSAFDAEDKIDAHPVP